MHKYFIHPDHLIASILPISVINWETLFVINDPTNVKFKSLVQNIKSYYLCTTVDTGCEAHALIEENGKEICA